MSEHPADTADQRTVDDAARPLETDGLDEAGLDATPDDADADALEDIEHDGKTYQVPKALKGAFLRQADYTRKTQELADERRAVEVERGRSHQALEASAGLKALEHKIAGFDGVDWDQLQRQDPEGAAQLHHHLGQLVAAHDHLADELSHHHAQQQAVEHHEHMARVQQGHAVLERDIVGWSPELAQRLAGFAMNEYGVTPDELAELHDPRVVKLLHAAYVGANASKLNRQALRHEQAQVSKPAATVSGRAAAGKDPNRMSTDEWMRHRNGQLRRQR